MKKVIILSLIASCLANINANNPNTYHPSNAREISTGNTFLHILAYNCEKLTVEEFFKKLNEFRKDRGDIPEPTLLNHYGLNAAEIAQINGDWNGNNQCKQIANILEDISLGYIQGIDRTVLYIESTTRNISDEEIHEWYKNK